MVGCSPQQSAAYRRYLRRFWPATALYEAGRTGLTLIGGRYGLGSKEFTPGMVRAVFDELMRAVTVALEGGVFVTASLTAKVLRGDARPALTARELEILALIAAGKTSRAIGRKLGITVRTVETHRAHIQQKLRMTKRSELVRYALDRKLLEA